MNTFQDIKTTARQRNKPTNVDSSAWANAMNWNIEAWKCHLKGQKWAHTFEICCPEQYFMLLDENGKFILSESTKVHFANTPGNRVWANRIKSQMEDMRLKGEWNEALEWSRLFSKLTKDTLLHPNEAAFANRKKTVKGYRLIRINTAA
jgi:hypothetical protein